MDYIEHGMEDFDLPWSCARKAEVNALRGKGLEYISHAQLPSDSYSSGDNGDVRLKWPCLGNPNPRGVKVKRATIG